MSDATEIDRTDPAWQPVWKNRRRTIFATLAFCALISVYVVWQDTGSVIHQTALESSFTLAGVVILGYVFGVVYQDTHGKR